MVHPKSILIFTAAVLFAFFPGTGIIGDDLDAVRSSLHKSPYFFVQGDPDIDQFPLLETKAEVHIAAFAAEVDLTQVYKNTGSKTLEAVYIFPLGTRSSIHEMRMKIGERIIDAEIKERKEAERIYEKAKADGKTASLLQQKRPNVFQMNAGNILPGDIIEVTITYTEILIPEKSVYEFVFPTVAGPRFTGEKIPEELKGLEEWTNTPYLPEGNSPPHLFSIGITLRTGIPLSNVSVPSHKVNIQHLSQDRAKITLSDQEKYGSNRDFILRYSLDGQAIHTGLLLYPGKEENYFLLMVKPPESPSMEMVPPREYIFIVDVSGSMSGFPLEVSKELIRTIITGLRKEDLFNIIFFAGGSKTLSPIALKGTADNKGKALAMLKAQHGKGGTHILNALQRAYSLKKTKGISRIIVAATDGYVNVEKEAFNLIRKNFWESNFFAFGIGKSVNRYIIEGMARAGKGEPFVVTCREEAAGTAEKFADYIESPLLTDTNVLYKGLYAYDMHPARLPDLFADRPLIIFGKYKYPKGSITVTGTTPMGVYTEKFNVSRMNAHETNAPIKHLWARKKIASLSDYTETTGKIRKEVTALGLKYNLMTRFTSFVAVDKITRNNGEIVTVKQPLPLPRGVSDRAVGCSGGIRAVELQGEGWVGVFGVGGGGSGAYGWRDGGGKRRAIGRFGGGAATESCVSADQNWLNRHQAADGSWSFKDYTEQCTQKPACTSLKTVKMADLDRADNGATGFALLCFLGAGHTNKAGRYRNQVADGLNYLQGNQRADGSFSSSNFIHAVSTIAAAEAYGMTKNPVLKDIAEKATVIIIKRQNPDGGWGDKSVTDSSSTFVTGWNICALKSARSSGIDIGQTFDKAGEFLDNITPAIKEGKIGYCADRYSLKAGTAVKRDYLSTVICLISRIFIGQDTKDKLLQALAAKVLERIPKDYANANLYEWYFGSLSMFQLGGTYWKKWNPSLKQELVNSQIKGGCADGSWEPTANPLIQEGGRIMATALNTLCLEIYYRYLPVSMLK